MADFHSSLAGKVAKLLPMLSSDCEGEVLATARGLVRTLQSAGLDLHDLAAVILTPQTVTVNAGLPKAEPPQSWRDLARWCRDYDKGRLTSKERKFVTDMTLRLTACGEPTKRQAEWLQSIFVRLWEAPQ